LLYVKSGIFYGKLHPNKVFILSILLELYGYHGLYLSLAFFKMDLRLCCPSHIAARMPNRKNAIAV